jgi:phospholipid transport system substrate-binding protein
VTSRRWLLAALPITAAIGTLRPRSGFAARDAIDFMNQLWTQANEVLSDKVPLAERQARFRALFQSSFDGPGIARFVLGRYWRTASEEEKEEFVRLFQEYIVIVYATRLSGFGGETFKIRASRPEDGSTIVSTDIQSPNATSPLKVDWRLVSEGGGNYKISDVVVEGVSMLVTQRSEFASVIQRHGGQVRGLLTLMREKTASAAQ